MPSKVVGRIFQGISIGNKRFLIKNENSSVQSQTQAGSFSLPPSPLRLPTLQSPFRGKNFQTLHEKIFHFRTLDAFLYDAVVLEYLAGKDDNCEILTVGKWFSMTGYGIGFPKDSKWLPLVNKWIMEYQQKGDLERLQNFWLVGACKPKQQSQRIHSIPLGIENFTSAFILLAVGTVILERIH